MATNCEKCGRSYVEVALEIGGRELRMRSCSYCDRREWIGPEGTLDLGDVLESVQTATAR